MVLYWSQTESKSMGLTVGLQETAGMEDCQLHIPKSGMLDLLRLLHFTLATF